VGGRWATQPKPKDGKRWEHNCGGQMGNTSKTKETDNGGSTNVGGR